jgi:hypothetical protein
MRTRENDPSLKNKSCDVRSVDLADFDDESRAAALEQIERHHARIKEQKRILDALKEVKEIKADTPGSPHPAGDGVGPNALGKVVVANRNPLTHGRVSWSMVTDSRGVRCSDLAPRPEELRKLRYQFTDLPADLEGDASGPESFFVAPTLAFALCHLKLLPSRLDLLATFGSRSSSPTRRWTSMGTGPLRMCRSERLMTTRRRS